MKDTLPHIALRPPEQVMRLSRLGSSHQTRLSFMRILLRRLSADRWSFERQTFEIDDNGVGRAVYLAKGPERTYALVAFAHDLPDELRSDRVIAEAWDATFTLFDGIPTDTDLERLERNVPLQEAGRVSERELTLSRANRSARLWEHVVSSLANGNQPEKQVLEAVGYLMRTTAVYGSGKFGAADREVIAARAETRAPFQAEMLTVYLIRWFVRELVEHLAKARGGSNAVQLADDAAKALGIGNSTGLGMAPFLINHPVLFNNWIVAREEALRRVRSLETVEQEDFSLFRDRLERVGVLLQSWRSEHPLQQAKFAQLKDDYRAICVHLETFDFRQALSWNRLVQWSQQALSEEGQELLNALVLEPYGALVDDLSKSMSDDEAGARVLDGAMRVGEVLMLLESSFGWTSTLDWEQRPNCARAWYVSEEKLEPRLGERFEEPLAEFEQPLSPARDAAAAIEALKGWAVDTPVADFLLACPEHRQSVERAQLTRVAPYGEIRDNTIAADVMPIDMLRAKLSFFGATRFDPRSDRWVRITMFAGAPYPNALDDDFADDWVFPEHVA
ncbi:hypothetical protein BXY66_1964 [Shimia isoporae]|uniref:Uncharacterized protein n=1 Tax=Shimia isoporae TaxID=647720 RepID=A0A4R1NPW3_9RHOB|nr:hypothetical protein [Shimia isoporae]TCL09899.1 hypothetical protein BXY66_1964 [Shimia isoporae]